MKKLFAGFIGVCLMLILFLGSFGIIAAARAATSGDYQYAVASGNATITKYIGRKGVVVIPSTLGGWPVRTIDSYAFQYCTALTNVTIPASVTSIGDAAFQGCAALSSVILRGEEPSCGERAFQGCEKMAVVYSPEKRPTKGTSGQAEQNEEGNNTTKHQPGIKGEQKNYSFLLVILFTIFLVAILLFLGSVKNKRDRT